MGIPAELLLAGLFSGGGSAIQGVLGQLGANEQQDALEALLSPTNQFNVQPQTIDSNSLFSQLLQELQAGFGRTPDAQRAAAPFAQAREEILAVGAFSNATKAEVLRSLDELEATGNVQNSERFAQLNRGLRRTTFGNSDTLLGAVESFNADQERFSEAFGQDELDTILQGRVDNQLRIAGLLSEEQPTDVRGLAGQLDEERVRALSEQADVLGINPAGLIAEDSTALTRALQLFTGQQALRTNELGARFAAQAGAQNPALGASSLLAQSQANASSIAANQALARAGTQAGVAANTGQGTAQLGQTIGGGLGDIASLLLLGSVLNKPGTGTVPPVPTTGLP